MSTDLVTCTAEDHIAVVTLNAPPMNVTTLELTRQLNAALRRTAEDPQVRVLVLTGAGDRAFCAGSDIKEFPSLIAEGDVVERKLTFENDTFALVDEFPKPTIAALNGLAYGGGLELAACCDLIIGEAGTEVALPEIKLGVIPASGGPIRVTRRLGEARGKEMMFFGDPVSAETAHSWGLLNRVVPRGRALETALELAARLAELPASALSLVKQAVHGSREGDRDAVRSTLPLSEQAFAAPDAAEGVRAFLDKRAPRFNAAPER